MRPARLRPFALLLAAAVAVAACAGSAPGWTYAPAPSITPPPSVEPSAEPSAPASDGPSAGPSAEPSAAPSGDVTVLDIAALNIAFDTDALTAPADQPFQIRFANNDPGIPHNVEIRDQGGASVFLGDIFNGVETRTYDVPALPAGSYQFLCTVHPNMVGTLTVAG